MAMVRRSPFQEAKRILVWGGVFYPVLCILTCTTMTCGVAAVSPTLSHNLQSRHNARCSVERLVDQQKDSHMGKQLETNWSCSATTGGNADYCRYGKEGLRPGSLHRPHCRHPPVISLQHHDEPSTHLSQSIPCLPGPMLNPGRIPPEHFLFGSMLEPNLVLARQTHRHTDRDQPESGLSLTTTLPPPNPTYHLPAPAPAPAERRSVLEQPIHAPRAPSELVFHNKLRSNLSNGGTPRNEAPSPEPPDLTPSTLPHAQDH